MQLFSLPRTNAHSFMTNATPAQTHAESWPGASRTSATLWQPSRPKHLRHGSIPTPRLKLEFFQHGGNHTYAFLAKTIPDTGSSRSVFGSNFVDKYNLYVDESAEARSALLYNASSERMGIRGILDIQAMYNGTMVHLDGLVLKSDLAAPLISWHDLTQLGICSLPDGIALCNFCADPNPPVTRPINNAKVSKEIAHVAATAKK